MYPFDVCRAFAMLGVWYTSIKWSSFQSTQ